MPLSSLDIVSVDSTFIQNKLCKDTTCKNPHNKCKRGSRVSTIVDSKGVPLSITVDDSDGNDAKLFFNVFAKMTANKSILKKIHKRTKFLADKGYDSKKIRNKILSRKMIPIIGYNKRNTKDISKIKFLTADELKIYKKRIRVEHLYAFYKKYPKINSIYEKTLESYRNLVFIVSSFKVIKNTIT